MVDFKWNINNIRTVLFFNKQIDFKKHDWSKIITQKTISNEITQEEEGVKKQYIETTILSETKQFNLIFVNEQNILDFQFSFENDTQTYTLKEIAEKIKECKSDIQNIYKELDDDVIRIGHIIELRIPLTGKIFTSNILKENISYFKCLGDDLEEINFRSNKTEIFENVKVNKVIQYAEAQRMIVDFDPQIGIPKAKVQKNLLFNIDINTDAKYKDLLNIEKISDFLTKKSVDILENGGIYDN